MAVVSGKVIQPLLFGFKSPIPASTEYLYFIVMNNQRKKPFHRMLECLVHDRETGHKCGSIHFDLNKFFDHLRVHTMERPFECT